MTRAEFIALFSALSSLKQRRTLKFQGRVLTALGWTFQPEGSVEDDPYGRIFGRSGCWIKGDSRLRQALALEDGLWWPEVEGFAHAVGPAAAWAAEYDRTA